MFNFKFDNTQGLQLYQIIRYAAVFIISVLLVKLSLSPKDIGYYEITLFISNFLTYFWINGLIQALLTQNPEINKTTKKPDLFNIFMIVLVFSIFSGLIGITLKNWFVKFQGVQDIKIFSTIILYTIINAPTVLIEHIYLLKNQPKKMIYYGFLSNALLLIFVLVPILLDLSIVFSIYGLLAISVLRFCWLLIMVASYSTNKFSINTIITFLKNGIPLSLKFLISGSGNYIDGLIISSRFDSSTFALYRYGARDIPLVTILVNSFSNSMLPKFSKTANISVLLSEIKIRSLKLMHWLFPISIVLLFLTKPIFPIVFNNLFLFSANIFLIFILLISSRVLFPQTILIGLQKTKIVFFVSLIELALNVILSLVLLNLIGIEGVALSTVIVYLFEKIALAIYLYNKMNIKPQEYIPIKQYSIYLIILLSAYLTARFLF